MRWIVLIPLAITVYKCQVIVSISCYLTVIEIEPATPRWFHSEAVFNQTSLSCWTRQIETPEEGRRIYHPKRWECNNENENNSKDILNDKKYYY